MQQLLDWASLLRDLWWTRLEASVLMWIREVISAPKGFDVILLHCRPVGEEILRCLSSITNCVKQKKAPSTNVTHIINDCLWPTSGTVFFSSHLITALFIKASPKPLDSPIVQGLVQHSRNMSVSEPLGWWMQLEEGEDGKAWQNNWEEGVCSSVPLKVNRFQWLRNFNMHLHQ